MFEILLFAANMLVAKYLPYCQTANLSQYFEYKHQQFFSLQLSFSDEEIWENLRTFIKAVQSHRPEDIEPSKHFKFSQWLYVCLFL